MNRISVSRMGRTQKLTFGGTFVPSQGGMAWSSLTADLVTSVFLELSVGNKPGFGWTRIRGIGFRSVCAHTHPVTSPNFSWRPGNGLSGNRSAVHMVREEVECNC